MHGRKECVRLLLRRGARHDITSIGGHTVLHLASANRHLEVVKRLVDAGARVNSRNAHGNTALHSAAATGTVDVFRVSPSEAYVIHLAFPYRSLAAQTTAREISQPCWGIFLGVEFSGCLDFRSVPQAPRTRASVKPHTSRSATPLAQLLIAYYMYDRQCFFPSDAARCAFKPTHRYLLL